MGESSYSYKLDIYSLGVILYKLMNNDMNINGIENEADIYKFIFQL